MPSNTLWALESDFHNVEDNGKAVSQEDLLFLQIIEKQIAKNARQSLPDAITVQTSFIFAE